MVPVLISLVGLLAIASIGLYRLAKRKPATREDLDWLDSFSLEPYRVMERLMLPADSRFLGRWRECSPQMIREFRRQRRRVLRRYVRELHQDFDRIQAVARLKVASSPNECGEMSLFLLQSSLLFGTCRLVVDCGLMLHAIGWTPGCNVRSLIAPVEVVLLYTRQTPIQTVT